MEKTTKTKSNKPKVFIVVAVILGVLVIPLLYSYFYLGAFWDPYAQLNDVPVAVVNLDKGANINGDERNIGKEICKDLKEDGSVKFIFTDEKTAKAGVEGSDYYAEILIPADFSENVSTASSNTKKVQAQIQYIANQKRNYLAAQILENAMPTIKESVNGKINEEITTTLTDKLYEVPDSLEILQDGLNQLFNGSTSLKNGTKSLSEATVTISTGTQKLANGAADLTNGLTVFKDGTSTLSSGATQVDAGVVTLQTGANALKDGTSKLAGNIPALKSGITKINNGAATANSGVILLNNGATVLKNGTAEFDKNLQQYTAGVGSAANGTDKILGGVAKIDGGIDKLSDGVALMQSKLKNGSKDMSDGIEDLINGATTLDTSIKAYTSGVATLVQSYETANSLLASSYPYISDATTKAQVGSYLTAINTTENKTLLATLKGAGPQLSAGSTKLLAGLNKLKTDSSASLTELSKGLEQVSLGLKDLKAGCAQLSNGSDTLQSGLKYLESKNEALLGASSQIKGGALELSGGLNDLSVGTNLLANGTSNLLTSSNELANGVTKLDDGAGKLTSGINYLKSATSKLADGANQIDSNTTTIKNGATTLKNGIDTLNNGSSDLKDGVSKLDNGANELNDGVLKAKTGVDDNVDSTNEQMGALDGLSAYTNSPVTTSSSYVEPVANYGSAFAPYFMSLSLWVGGLMIFFGIYLDYERKIRLLSKASDHVVLRAFTFMLLGLCQAVLLAFVIKHILHITVNNTGMLYFSCCLVSLAFISIIQFCLVHLGDAGKFVALLLLILQLTSCAGTFPIETVPTLFQKLYPYMPMTYSTLLFKESISGRWNSTATKASIILALIMIVFMLITTILSAMRDRHKIKAALESAAQTVKA